VRQGQSRRARRAPRRRCAAAPPNRTLAAFLDRPPPADALASASGIVDEQITLGPREIYVHYGSGMARSKLKIPAARDGTARNINTIATLAASASERRQNCRLPLY
jgi:uncharacterized protein (DUF1697 family)